MFYERNKVLTMLEQKKIPLCIQCFTGNTELVEVMGATGFDFVMFDCVHSGNASGGRVEPYAIVNLLDADGLTGQRSAEINFLFENANFPAVSNQSGAIVEGVRKFTDAAIGPRGRFIDVGGALHFESFLRTFVVELANESVELGLLLQEVATGRACSFDF